MAYFLNLFSPETHENFSTSDRKMSGFRLRQKKAADRIKPGDRLICYVTKLSRWIGLFEVKAGVFEDATPRFLPENDPFVLRFPIEPLVWLPFEYGIPIRHDTVWNKLSFTRDHDKDSITWTGYIRSSLAPLNALDGKFLEELLLKQSKKPNPHPLDAEDYKKLKNHVAKRLDGVISVTVPDDAMEYEPGEMPVKHASDVRESTKIQALIAKIGATMGMRVWIPVNDQGAVSKEWNGLEHALVRELPLNYDETTIDTIKHIDVLWLRGRSIVRAFEVEHTTAIYSGILRMADLLSLQPNMDIRLHIVAPEERKNKVCTEIRRPVFALLERGALSKVCTFLSYDSMREIAGLKHLEHLSDKVISDYEVPADEE